MCSIRVLFLDKGTFEVQVPLQSTVRSIIATLADHIPRDEVVAMFEKAEMKQSDVRGSKEKEFPHKLAVHLRLFCNNFPIENDELISTLLSRCHLFFLFIVLLK